MRGVHVTLTHFENESRVLKEVNSLLDGGIVQEIIVLALWKEGLAKRAILNDRIKVIRINLFPIYVINYFLRLTEIKRNKLITVFINLYLIALKPSIISIHHVNILGIVNLKKVFRKTLFIYDTHELETETQSSVGKLKEYQQQLERKFISRVDHVFVVTPSIESWYRSTYNVQHVTTVMNTPPYIKGVKNEDLFRKEFGIEKDATIFIYNGSLFLGRGILILIEAFETISEKSNHIVFMGNGNLEQKIIDASKRNSNIHFKKAVAPSEVIRYTTSADVGISLIENVCLSYYHCLPNKIFEYTMSEIPLIVSNMIDMSNYVEQNEIGVVTESLAVDDVIKSIEQMSLLKDKFENELMSTKKKFNWQNEEKKMLTVYKHLLNEKES